MITERGKEKGRGKKNKHLDIRKEKARNLRIKKGNQMNHALIQSAQHSLQMKKEREK